jgi:hypothetical protein
VADGWRKDACANPKLGAAGQSSAFVFLLQGIRPAAFGVIAYFVL